MHQGSLLRCILPAQHCVGPLEGFLNRNSPAKIPCTLCLLQESVLTKLCIKKSNPLLVHLMIRQYLHTKSAFQKWANMSPMMLKEVTALVHLVRCVNLFDTCEAGSVDSGPRGTGSKNRMMSMGTLTLPTTCSFPETCARICNL
mmetsp:Transcript_2761/g.17219  ORF Transcript_2761/g.17219 Transcript_2761/m.17219 type:complete len:144 (-) Transcript_2761:1736-2167(-)